MRPPTRVVAIAVRQPPHAMQMVGHHRNGEDIERSRPSRRTECIAQQRDVLHLQAAATLQQVHSEKVGTARQRYATIARRTCSLPASSRDHPRRRPRIPARKALRTGGPRPTLHIPSTHTTRAAIRRAGLSPPYVLRTSYTSTGCAVMRRRASAFFAGSEKLRQGSAFGASSS